MANMRFTVLPDQDIVSEAESSSPLRTGLRHVGRTAARIGESALGLPGDIVSGGIQLAELTNKGLEKLTGFERPNKEPKRFDIHEYLPTSTNINKHITKRIESRIGEGSLSPQSKGEERSDELVSDITSFLFPFGGAAKKSLNIAKNIGVPLAANAAKWLTEDITGSEGLGSGVKLGTMLLGSFAGGRKQLEKRAKDLYKQAESPRLLKKSIPVKKTLQKSATYVMDSIGGIDSPSKSLVKKVAGDVLNATAGKNTATIGELVDADRVIKELFRTNEHALSANPKSKQLLTKLGKGIKDAISSTKSKYPRFYNSYTEANDIYRGLRATDTLRDNIAHYAEGKHYRSPLTSFLVFKDPSKIGLYAGAQGAARLLKAPYDFVKSVMTSPSIAKHYGNMLKAAAYGKVAATLKELDLLDTELNKEYPGKPRFTVID